MANRKNFTITAILMLISVTSFSGTQPTKSEAADIGHERFWTCYAMDAADRTFPGLEKEKETALKTAMEKCSFFSEASDSCRLSQEDCEIDEL